MIVSRFKKKKRPRDTMTGCSMESSRNFSHLRGTQSNMPRKHKATRSQENRGLFYHDASFPLDFQGQ